MPLLLYITRYDHFDFDGVDDKVGGKSVGGKSVDDKAGGKSVGGKSVDDKTGGKSFCAQVAAVKESLERKQRRLTSLLARSKLRRYRRHNHHN